MRESAIASSSENQAPTRLVLEQAAQWFVLLASGEASADQRRRWHAWRLADPSHALAWQRVEDATGRCAQIPPDQASASLRALSPAPGVKSRARRTLLGQFAVLLAAGLAGWQGYRRSDWSADLVCAVGEQRQTVLADGSRLLLDTDSAVDVDFSARTRLIRLRRGRIMIVTATDPGPGHRPLMVETAQGRVVALGTQFTVQQDPASTRVSVLEARVALYCAHAGGDAPIVGAGQTARFDGDGLVDQHQAPLAESAWVHGMLVANDLRLGDLLEQLARYRAEPLTCDPDIAELRISGAFPLRDTDRVLAALSETLPIEVDRQVDGRSGLLVRRK